MAKKDFYGWKLLAALSMVVLINQGMAHFGGPIINSYMAHSLHLDRTALGTLFSVYMVAMGVGSLILAPLERQLGVKGTLVFGSLLLLFGAGAMATIVSGVIGASVAYGAGVGLAVMVGGQLPVQVALANWFVRKRALAFSIMWCASGIGGTIAPLLMDWLIRETGNWRIAWSILSGLALVSVALVLVFLKMNPSELGQYPDGEAGGQADVAVPIHGSAGGVDWPVADALRSPTLWLIFAATLGPTIGFHVFLAHGFPHLKDIGFSPAGAASAMSVMTVAFIFGNLLVGVLGDRIDPRLIWVGISLVFAGGTFLIIHPGSHFQLYLAAFCLGAGFGGSVVSLMTVLANYYGAKALLSLSGIAVAVQMAFGAAAPAVAGSLYDRTHDYRAVFIVATVIAVANAVLLIVIRRPVLKNAA